MRFSSLLAVAAGTWLAAQAPGFAQPVDSGLEVQVNPGAAGGARLYPGETYGPIHLHMPTARRIVHAAPKAKKLASVAPAPVAATSTPSPAAPETAPSLFGATSKKPAAKSQPAQIAKNEPAQAQNTNLTKRSVILFAKDSSDPAQAALGAIKFLAGDLNGSMTNPGSRIELQAFGGAKGDKGSDARRLSLKRALAIRQVLIDDGVSPERIDVRAMGGSDDSGPADRVDVYVKA